jgi:hypothetical protein
VEIEHSDYKAENLTMKGDYLWQLVEVVIGGVPTISQVHFMCLFMSLSPIVWQRSRSTNLFDPIRHQVDLRTVDVSIELLRNIYLTADIILQGVHFAPLFRRRAGFTILFPYLLFASSHVRFPGHWIWLSLFSCFARVRNHL